MNRVCVLILTLVALLSIPTALLCAEPDQGNARGVYLKEVPSELARQLRERLDNCTKDFAVTEEVAGEVRKAITDFDFSKASTMKALLDKLTEIGPGAAPIVDEFIVSQDDSVREKAIFALRCMAGGCGNIAKDGTTTDSLVVTLLHRSILDKNPKVRQSAMIGLRNIASVRVGSARADAISALQEACSDPDPDLRRFAEECGRAVESAALNSDSK